MLPGHVAEAAALALSLSPSLHAASARRSGTASAAATMRPRGPADIDVLSVVWSGRRLHTSRWRSGSGDAVDDPLHNRWQPDMWRRMRGPGQRRRPKDVQTPF